MAMNYVVPKPKCKGVCTIMRKADKERIAREKKREEKRRKAFAALGMEVPEEETEPP